jgi:hypothetical protein
MGIPVLGKFESKTKNGKLVDYSAVDGAPIIEADLTVATLTANTYYKHTGETGTYTTGVIYYYNGSSLKPIDGSGSGGEGGLGSQEVKDIVNEQLKLYSTTQEVEDIIDEQLEQMVKTVKVGDTSYSPTDGVISLPAYPTGTGGGETSTTALSVVLEVNGWVDNTQTVAVEGVTETNHVFVSSAGVPTEFVKSLIYPSAQGKNQITFTCEEKPTKNITVNVLILAKIVEVNSIEITLATSGWNEAKRQTIEGLDISGNNNIISKPKGSPSAYLEAGIYCVSQGNGWLIFECDTVPTTDIEVIILTI